jgi:hypothetical protein
MGINLKFARLLMAVNPGYEFFKMAAPVTSGLIFGVNVVPKHKQALQQSRLLRRPKKQVEATQEESDFLTQLAYDVLDGAKLSDLQTLFADDLQISHNPMGSLTTPSAVIVPGPKVMTWDDWVTTKTVVVRRTRRKEVVPEGQMGFGI